LPLICLAHNDDELLLRPIINHWLAALFDQRWSATHKVTATTFIVTLVVLIGNLLMYVKWQNVKNLWPIKTATTTNSTTIANVDNVDDQVVVVVVVDDNKLENLLATSLLNLVELVIKSNNNEIKCQCISSSFICTQKNSF
jgi:hypothetical protein